MQDTATLLSLWLDPVAEALNADAARRLLAIRADDQTQSRVEALADRNTEGQLTAEERSEYESLVAAAAMVNVLQAKARARLAADRDGGTNAPSSRHASEPTAA